jgi:hypothetical protein
MDEQNFTDFIKRRKTLVPPIGVKSILNLV